MPFSSRLSLFLATSLLLGACSSVPANFYDPVDTKLQATLPDVNGAAPDTQDMHLFSFRVITPVENVNLFSILQAAGNEPIVPNQQNTLPIAQLSVVQVAKTKIYSHDYLNPEEASLLAFDAARQYAWDPEVARLVMVEILKVYAQRRDADLAGFRKLAEERAQYFIAKNKIAQTEFNDQAKDALPNYFNGIPVTTAEQEAARQKQLADQASFRKNYAAYSQQKIEENKRAQDEYAKQAKDALNKYLQQLDDTTKAARKKEEEAQALRKAQFDQILANQKKIASFSVKDVSPSNPYALVTLTNGDFMLESAQTLPAVIELSVDGINEPVPIPVLPQTAHGRLLISINQDAQGHPIVLGGMDADSGAQFDINQVMFKIETTAGQQQLEFLYPDGRVESLALAKLAEQTSDANLSQLGPATSQLDSLALQQRQSLFSQIHYQLTPELDYLPPAEALDILNGVMADSQLPQ